ncbi:cilia and flagella-associated protein isoform X1 [Capsicum annuum]|uniref:cilia- and flagella-associated protein 298 isoform X1 n=1 Tax=Capsicum annuum TaxID=4072 RepID=UPI0007BFA1FE|nr:cilia- and flagella-associated protein 298 isoform X1 [Capsicum annuum]
MVRLHVKHGCGGDYGGGGGGDGGAGEFLYETETSSMIDEIANHIIEIANLQSKIQCLAGEFEPCLSKLQGDPKVMPLVRALSEAMSYASKDQVVHNKPLSIYVLRDHTRSIEKEFLVTYSVMGLSSPDLQQFLSDLQILEENTVQLLWAGKELTRGKKLCDFIGRNEKTKIVIRLQSLIPPPASLSGGEKS